MRLKEIIANLTWTDLQIENAEDGGVVIGFISDYADRKGGFLYIALAFSKERLKMIHSLPDYLREEADRIERLISFMIEREEKQKRSAE
jgi:hypothetical protein